MKRFLIGWPIIFIAWMLGSFQVHGVALRRDYAKLPALFRPEDDAKHYLPIMLLAHVIMAGALTWIYSRGVNDQYWLAQGLRFGLAVALLGVVPTYMIYYAVQPMPGELVVKQIIGDGFLVLLLGVIVARIYRKDP